METFTAEEASQNLVKLIDLAQQNCLHFRITSTNGNIVVLSEETYHNLMVTLELLATPGLMDEFNLKAASEV